MRSRSSTTRRATVCAGPASRYVAGELTRARAAQQGAVHARVLRRAPRLRRRRADPIFIVGLPRAGSTLIEQILSSHSQVEGTMELPDMPAIAQIAV